MGCAPSSLSKLASRLRGEVRLGLHDRMLYATDASIYQVEPIGVVIPADLDDAADAAAACAELGLPILPRGGGTSLVGQCVNEAVVVDLSANCRGVSAIDTDGRTCRAEAGATIDAINATLAPTGLFFAPDPATVRQATIGGCIGNNAAGARSIKYGRTSENVLGVDVCLADGRRVRLDGSGLDPVAADLSRRVAGVVRGCAGLIRERFPKTRRRNAGYQLDMILDQIEAGVGDDRLNLAPLICGSEGTLAVTLSATLLLHPIPSATGLAVIAFGSVDEAIDAVGPLLETNPSAVELIDSMLLDLARANIEQRRHLEMLPGGGGAGAVLYVEYQENGVGLAAQCSTNRDREGVNPTLTSRDREGAASLIPKKPLPDGRGSFESGSFPCGHGSLGPASGPASGREGGTVRARLDAIRGRFGPDAVACFTDPASMERAWALRKAGEPLLHGIAGDRKPVGFIEDAAVPPERLGEYVRRLRAIIEGEGTRASFFAHASVGVLHVRPLLDLRAEPDRGAMERIAVASADLAKALGGVMSGEHGDGRARGPLLERFYGPELMDAFRQIKAIFDPENRLNPGNIVEPGPIASIHERTRLGAERAVGPPAETFFDFGGQGGLGHAAGLCNGAGVCRKTAGGVMCPSYRATLDERHSTRGRGNALRLAITGQLGGGGSPWLDAGTMATLDLCLSCKACKSECPSNVDIAKLKAEYLAQGYRGAGRVPLRARVFGHIHTLNRLGGLAPGAANLVSRLGRGVLNRALGLHPGRSLPGFERPLHKQWRTARLRSRLLSECSSELTVLLYADTFTAYNEPSLGLAARRVLEAFGYRVELFRGSDAGRALISMGLLGAAIRRADREMRELLPRLDRVEAVLFLEPSCLSAVRDDWLSLKCGVPLADRRRLAEKALSVEQFLDERWGAHPRVPVVAEPGGEILVHAHCHQRALWGAAGAAGLLDRLFPGRVRVLDATCCGLAGSFGYTKERFDLSMRIGELGVLPAARGLGPGGVIAAAGMSCRHQIADGAGVRAVHPVEVVASLLSLPRP